MRQCLVLLGLVAVASAAWTGGLRHKFDINVLGYGSKSFFDLPRTVSAALKAGYTQKTRLAGLPLPSLKLYCPASAALCTLYDDTDFIAGLQIGVKESDFKPHFDLEVMGMEKWTADDGVYWIMTEYLVSESFLQTPAATRVAKRNPKTVLQDKAVWVTGPKGQLIEIPRDEKKIGQTKFTTQACIPLMGRHYYYNMSPSTKCTAEDILSWFPLYDSNELVGVGFMNFGPLAVDKRRDAFERPAVAAVKAIVNSGPQCLYDLATSPGALTMHTYFIDNPRLITCLPNPFGIFGK